VSPDRTVPFTESKSAREEADEEARTFATETVQLPRRRLLARLRVGLFVADELVGEPSD
jgi:hypothetical protein